MHLVYLLTHVAVTHGCAAEESNNGTIVPIEGKIYMASSTNFPSSALGQILCKKKKET
jgi:hypothetical protein